MTVTASELRNNIYRLLDQVAEGGKPITISRKGHVLQIVRQDKPAKLARLTKRDCLTGNPDDLVHLDWSREWNHDLP